MKQELNPVIAIGSIFAVVVVAGIIGFVVFANRPNVNNGPVPGSPPPVAASQMIGPEANVAGGPGPGQGGAAAASQTIGAGAGGPGPGGMYAQKPKRPW